MSGVGAGGRGVAIPFATVVLIWGSTFFVIRDQLGIVPPSWSVAYRFALSGVAMLVLAKVRGMPLRIDGRTLIFAAVIGVMQFVLNFNLVYRAEGYITSGLVALLYALLIVPNSLLAWVAYRRRVERGFLIGSAIACVGVALLFVQEYRDSTLSPEHVLIGIALGLCGVMSASVANVMQGGEAARRVPMLVLLGWAMTIGAVIDIGFAGVTAGTPTYDPRPSYGLGVAYLALAGSVVTFPLYFTLIQKMGAGKAAYINVLTPILAMALSTWFEGYRWTVLAGGGAALAIVGMAIALRARAYSSDARPSR